MEAYKQQDELWDKKGFCCDTIEDCADCKICGNNGRYRHECNDEEDCENCPHYNTCLGELFKT